MSRIVDHEKRKREILGKALLLFSEQGYSSVTFQKIADDCSISRTTLYRYFSDKREILDASIQNFFTPLIEKLRAISKRKDLPVESRLEKVLMTVVDSLGEEVLFLERILDYLLRRKSSGEEIGVKIMRHTWKLRLLIQRLLQEGVEKGEFRSLDLRTTNNLLYSQLETHALRLVVRENSEKQDTIDVINKILSGLKAYD